MTISKVVNVCVQTTLFWSLLQESIASHRSDNSNQVNSVELCFITGLTTSATMTSKGGSTRCRLQANWSQTWEKKQIHGNGSFDSSCSERKKKLREDGCGTSVGSSIKTWSSCWSFEVLSSDPAISPGHVVTLESTAAQTSSDDSDTLTEPRVNYSWRLWCHVYCFSKGSFVQRKKNKVAEVRWVSLEDEHCL